MTPAHFRNAEGLATLNTPEIEKLIEDIKSISDPRQLGLMVVRGTFGTGKTYAVQLLLELINNIDWVYVKAQQSLTPGRLCRLLGERIEGVRWSGDSYDLRMDLIDLLSERPYLIAIDEAQTLTPSTITELRTLFDEDSTTLGLILIGSAGLDAKLAANGALLSRCSRDVLMTPFSDSEAVHHLPEFHPVFAEVERSLLREINGRCLGLFRHWTEFAVDAARICRQRDAKLDREVAEEVWAAQGTLRLRAATKHA
jgi:DNA transposition AAA+ family ATPase